MSKKNVVQSTALIAALTLVSKVMGFMRESLMARSFGLGAQTDAYNAALTATVVIMGVIGVGLNTTLVPVFSEIGQRKGMAGRRSFLNNILSFTVIISILITVVFFIFSPTIISFVAMGFKGEQFDLAVKLNRIGLPIVVLLAFTHVFMGYLQSLEVFGPYAVMGIPYNLVFILYLFIAGTGAEITTFMMVTVLAALMQVLIQVPAVRHSGYRLRPRVDLSDPYMRKVGMLIVPILISSSILQINIIIDKDLASIVGTGVMSALNYATKLNDLVLSVFIMAISTVVFPMMAEAFLRNDDKGTVSILQKAINLVMLITVPATVGLIVLATPIVKVAFERGAFLPQDTIMTAGALVFYAIGLMANAMNMVLNRVYYSYRDTKTPMVVGVICVVINLAFNLLLMKPLAHKGLALATSIANISATSMLFYKLREKFYDFGMKEMVVNFIKIATCASIMGVVVYFFNYKLGSLLGTRKLVITIMLFASMVVGATVYGVGCVMLKVPEVYILINKIKSKIITER
ncbi:MAG: murein biosynthesis integral membrane protein MurJ [Tissierellia bacterium]|nr:murein biosynthesis integral membrane protein MurJ [Tissierellia bacterium]